MRTTACNVRRERWAATADTSFESPAPRARARYFEAALPVVVGQSRASRVPVEIADCTTPTAARPATVPTSQLVANRRPPWATRPTIDKALRRATDPRVGASR